MITAPLSNFAQGRFTLRFDYNRTITFTEATLRDNEIMRGSLCLRGTRVLVRTLFDYIEGGNDLDYFLEGLPTVSRDQALAVLTFSCDQLESQKIA